MRRLFDYRVHFASTRSYVALSAENASIALRRALKVFRKLYGKRISSRIERMERAYPVPGASYSDHRPIKVPRP